MSADGEEIQGSSHERHAPAAASDRKLVDPPSSSVGPRRSGVTKAASARRPLSKRASKPLTIPKPPRELDASPHEVTHEAPLPESEDERPTMRLDAGMLGQAMVRVPKAPPLLGSPELALVNPPAAAPPSAAGERSAGASEGSMAEASSTDDGTAGASGARPVEGRLEGSSGGLSILPDISDPVVDSLFPPASLELGPIARFGRFDILGRLAVGGMADLLLARESVEGGASRNSVIKLIRGEFSEDGKFAQMFLDEGRLAMRLSHPAICTVYEVGRESGRFFMAMEFVEGRTLLSVVSRAVQQERVLPLPFLLRVFSQVAEALEFAHNVRDAHGRKLNIVHRDVSPNNIMIRYDGVVKLLDFGVAKAERNQSSTVAGTVKGKFSYMSPEQAMSEPLDKRSDIFSLGVCLYEAVTGRRLYRRNAQFEVLKAVIKDPAPSVLRFRPELPERLDHIIHRMLEKDAADRYQSAAHLQHDLDQLITEEKIVLSTRKVAAEMRSLFAQEIANGPELDRSHAVAERFAAIKSDRPSTVAAPVVIAPSLGLVGWIAAAVASAAVMGLGAFIALRPAEPGGAAPPPMVTAAPEDPSSDPSPQAASIAPSPSDPSGDPAARSEPETASNPAREEVPSEAEPEVTAPGLATDETTQEGPSSETSERPRTTRRRRRRSARRSGRRPGRSGTVIVTDPGFGP